MRHITSLLLSILLVLPYCSAAAQVSPLRFHEDGTFKVAQFTDLHIKATSENTPKVFDTMRQVISAEQPDLVLLTGDIVTQQPAADGWQMLTDFFAEEQQPYAVLLGNHDAEVLTKDSIFGMIVGKPYCLSVRGPEEIHGYGNQLLRIDGSKDDTPAALLYLLDSNQYYRDPLISYYDIVHFDQLGWLRETHREEVDRLGGVTPPSLLFFHIPTPEFEVLNNESIALGDMGEGVASAKINSGLFSTMLDMGGVMGAFVGHDHDNDAVAILDGIALGYGRHTGLDTYGSTEERGGRIILLYEGQRKFDTWLATPKGGRGPIFYYPSGFDSATEESSDYLPALADVHPTEHGVKYRYFEGTFTSTSDLESAVPVSEGTMPYPSIDGAAREDHFGYIFEALIFIPQRGIYRCYTVSDDGSVIYVDGEKVVDNDGGHSARLMEGEVALEEGFHRIRIDYFEDYMGEELEIGFSSKDLERQPVPAQILYLPSDEE